MAFWPLNSWVANQILSDFPSTLFRVSRLAYFLSCRQHVRSSDQDEKPSIHTTLKLDAISFRIEIDHERSSDHERYERSTLGMVRHS